MIKKRCVQCEHQADQVLKNFEKLLYHKVTAEVDTVAGAIFELIFLILPDCNGRKGFTPVGIGRLGKSHTTYRAKFAGVTVLYSASPLSVIVHQLHLPENFMSEQAMVA